MRVNKELARDSFFFSYIEHGTLYPVSAPLVLSKGIKHRAHLVTITLLSLKCATKPYTALSSQHPCEVGKQYSHGTEREIGPRVT